MVEGEYRTGEPVGRPCCKKARAEVLAACITRLRESRDACTLSQHSALFNLAIKVLQNLQPAASDLEALLREEWNKAIDHLEKYAKNLGHKNLAGGKTDWGKGYNDAMLEIESQIRFQRKEKARASEGKS